jgi:hypothetical protein
MRTCAFMAYVRTPLLLRAHFQLTAYSDSSRIQAHKFIPSRGPSCP